MTKLCPRGKAAAKRKFKVYPSAYANAYASKICAGKIKDPSGVKRKDFKGPKRAMGGMIKRATYMGGGLTEATQRLRRQGLKSGELVAGTDNIGEFEKKVRMKKRKNPNEKTVPAYDNGKYIGNLTQDQIRDYQEKKGTKNKRSNTRTKFKAMGGRINYRKGGGVCLRGMNKEAVGKNS